jgi:hypothetical protein
MKEDRPALHASRGMSIRIKTIASLIEVPAAMGKELARTLAHRA